MNDRHILDGLSAGLICHAVCHVSGARDRNHEYQPEEKRMAALFRASSPDGPFGRPPCPSRSGAVFSFCHNFSFIVHCFYYSRLETTSK